MGRLTIKDKNACKSCDIWDWCAEKSPPCPVYRVYEKLAHYEDLEEAGRLIELPCAVGEEVWIGHKIYSFGESVIKVVYDSISSIIVAMQDGFVFGRTKEEAEAKLAELKGE